MRLRLGIDLAQPHLDAPGTRRLEVGALQPVHGSGLGSTRNDEGPRYDLAVLHTNISDLRGDMHANYHWRLC
jgi:hypothetical protein